MLIHFSKPDLFSRRGIDRISVRGCVPEVGSISASPAAKCDCDRAANTALGTVGPIDASCLGIQRIHRAVVAPDEEASTEDGRLRPCRSGIGKTECPLQYQVRDLFGRQPRL